MSGTVLGAAGAEQADTGLGLGGRLHRREAFKPSVMKLEGCAVVGT